MTSIIRVNTSNPGKLKEYEEYFKPKTVVSQTQDLAEPNADPTTVIQYKASQFDGVIVDDVALDVEGLDVGVNIRWHLKQLGSSEYLGRRCTYVCRVAIKVNDVVKVYLGSVKGTLVEPRGNCFGFGKYFLPDGTDQTLGEYMNPKFIARYLAIEKFKKDDPTATLSVLKVWNGAFQSDGTPQSKNPAPSHINGVKLSLI